MVTPMIVTIRECLEMFIIIVPLLAYFYRMNRHDVIRTIYFGCLGGAATTTVLGVVLYKTTQDMEGYSQHLFLGFTMLFLAGLILYNIILLKKQNKVASMNLPEGVNEKVTKISMFILVFTTVFRESLEILIFVLPYLYTNILVMFEGIAAGLFIAVVCMVIISKTAAKLNINLIFTILTFLLIIIGANLFGEALGILLPAHGESIEKAGMLIYGIPLMFFFLKGELRKYSKRKL